MGQALGASLDTRRRTPLEHRIVMELGAEMRAVRSGMGLSLVGLTRVWKLPFKESILGEWERGERAPYVEDFLVWCESLDVDPGVVLVRVERRLAART